jgi:hypothetical protein
MNFPRTPTLRVQAKRADRPVPKIRRRRDIDRKTGRDRSLIYADAFVEVPNVRYYRRRCVTGELLLEGSVPGMRERVEAALAEAPPEPVPEGQSYAQARIHKDRAKAAAEKAEAKPSKAAKAAAEPKE